MEFKIMVGLRGSKNWLSPWLG